MSRRREAQELAVALQLSTQQQSNLVTDSSISLVTSVSEQVVNSKDLELVEGNTMVDYAAREADIVADSEEEEEIEIPIDTPLTGPQRITAREYRLNGIDAEGLSTSAFLPSSIKSFTPSFLPSNALAISSAPPMIDPSLITPFTTSSEHQRNDIPPPLPSSEKKASSPIHPTVSSTIQQTLPSPRSSPRASVEPLLATAAKTSAKPTTYGAKKSSSKSITPHNPSIPLPEEDINVPSLSKDRRLSKPLHRRRAKVIENTDSEGGVAAESKALATTGQQPTLATAKDASDDTDFEQDRPESSAAASKRSSAKPSKKRTAVIESDEEEQASPLTSKRSRAEAMLSPHASTPTRNEQRGSSPDPLAMQSRSQSPSALTLAKPSSSTSRGRDVVESGDGTAVASEQIVAPAAEVEVVTAPLTGKGKKGKAAKGKAKAKATPKAKAAPRGKGKGKPTATQVEPEIGEAEREVERPVPSISAEVTTQVDAKVGHVADKIIKLTIKSPEKEKSATPPPDEPVRPPLASLRTDANRIHTPTRVRLQSDSPGPSKLGTGSKPILRTPQGLPLVAKFGGTKQTGMSRRSRLPSLHTKIKTPPKALPPAPIKPVRKKKGEESDDDDEDEFDADGNVVKKVKVKGMEWYMMED